MYAIRSYYDIVMTTEAAVILDEVLVMASLVDIGSPGDIHLRENVLDVGGLDTGNRLLEQFRLAGNQLGKIGLVVAAQPFGDSRFRLIVGRVLFLHQFHRHFLDERQITRNCTVEHLVVQRGVRGQVDVGRAIVAIDARITSYNVCYTKLLRA